MIYIPFFSRLSLTEYQGMLIAALFFIVEKFLRVVLVLFPVGYVIDAMPDWIISRLKLPQISFEKKEAEREFLDDFGSFAEIMSFWRYPFEDHLVETRDGFILGTHRITGPRQLSTNGINMNQRDGIGSSSSRSTSSSIKPVVLFWHGFMLSSECFVCHPDWVNILPFRLAEAGYDVWLGNSRGNKYSYKHIKYAPDDRRFWNFSIDEIANIDVPTTIDYILNETGASSLTYIGFSQGTAQMFMALSRNKQLNQKVSHFIALAPASTPRGFHNSIVDYFTKATPHMLYLLFGRRRAMSLVYFWINVLPRDLYVAALDLCVRLLFGWEMANLSQETKCIVYWHLYSYTSVKAIVHWMQIIRCGQLQMYDDDPPVYPLLWSKSPPDNISSVAPAKYGHGKRHRNRPTGAVTHWNNTYPLTNISTRISLFHGGSDSLSSVDMLLEELDIKADDSLCFRHYEHMDFLWADSVGTLVYPKVLDIMGAREHTSNIPPLQSLTKASTGVVEESRSSAIEDCGLPASKESPAEIQTGRLSRSVSTLSRRRIVSMPGSTVSSSIGIS